MTTMVENEKSSGRQPHKPNPEIDEGFGSVAARFDKVEADMREGFARVDQAITGLRGEMNGLRGEMNGQGDSLRGEMNTQGESLRAEMQAQGESLRAEMNTRFLALESSFNGLQRTLIVAAGAIIATLIGSAAINIF